MAEARKITIIEGPPPTFELIHDSWLLGLTEGPVPTRVAMCHVRTMNGPKLVERCYRAWRDGQPINLEFRTEDGLTKQRAIVAARWVDQPDGHLLLLWVRLDEDEIEFEIDFDVDDFDEDPGTDIDDIDFDILI